MNPSLCGSPPPYDDFKISPQPICFPGSINMETMIRQHTKFPLLLVLPGKPDHQAVHCPTANFGQLSRGSVTKLMLITAFDAYLTPRSQGAMSLAHIYVNLKEPCNQDIKEKVNANFFLKRRQTLHEIPNPRGIVCRRCFSNSISCLWC